MAAGHTHMVTVEGTEIATSAASGDPHTHTVRLDGITYKTSETPSGEAHTHNVRINEVVHTTGGPMEQDAEKGSGKKTKGKKKPYQKLLRKLADAHNRTKPAHKARIRPMEQVAKRAIEARESAQFPGIDEESWVVDRVSKYVSALAEKASTEDSDLLPEAHPAAPDVSRADPWAELDGAEERLAALAREGLAKMDRAGVRAADDEQLVEWNRRLEFLYEQNFARTEIDVSPTGLVRKQVVQAAGIVESELYRRGYGMEYPTALTKAAEAARGLPPEPGHGHFLSTAAGMLLRLENGPTLTLLDKREGSATGLESLASTWHPDGSRWNTPLREPHGASYIGTAKVGPSDEVAVAAEVAWSWGYRGEDVSELFISKGPLAGTLLVGKSEVSLREHLVPLVLTEKMVEAGWMPPEGESAMPPSLEQDVPPTLRFWKAAPGEDPQEIRDRLFTSRLFREDTIKLVNGEPRRVEVEYALADEELAPDQLAEVTPTLSPVERVVKLMPADFGVDTRVSTVANAAAALAGPEWEQFVEAHKGASAFLFDESLAEVSSPSEVADRLQAWPSDFIAAYPDTDSARRALSKAGRVFKLEHDAKDLLYVSSRPPVLQVGVVWVDSVPETPPPPPHQQTISEDVSKALQREVRLIKSEEQEERFVFGIVLEPETIDKQNDIYSAATIRKSAHRFMAEFRNAGLMHEGLINDQVQILESYLAPVDMDIEGTEVKKGTWLMAYKILSDTLWEAVKAGDLTGFSIGGSAIRTPEEV